ncbi:MAG: tRNA (adenosine(37)-N6)-threonylcarbamoyltransferase complex ATPase subunit type 1 TsaE [Haliscomenobacter sp.]|nr:tRNA (adenosine(37)-N6)-threonylcarbamoyltransferase complex ATPase subunit type 1 TsaE [Haliscomenobacter sp.]MBK8880176.1 tRNA (adenosine(37)-N6)-threonylcarbamoyltransferase complex ATPase subunit type 1 TsaE [Haliscomenobacter sp.]
MHTFSVNGKHALPETAREVLRLAGLRRKFALYGQLGAGKTALVQAICEILEVREPVASPTFALVNEYTYNDKGAEAFVYHIDLYRLHTLEEALDIGIEEYLDSPHYCFIEWPQLIEPLLDEQTVRINLEIEGDSVRKILFL